MRSLPHALPVPDRLPLRRCQHGRLHDATRHRSSCRVAPRDSTSSRAIISDRGGCATVARHGATLRLCWTLRPRICGCPGTARQEIHCLPEVRQRFGQTVDDAMIMRGVGVMRSRALPMGSRGSLAARHFCGLPTPTPTMWVSAGIMGHPAARSTALAWRTSG
jgi:hypothetical protein